MKISKRLKTICDYINQNSRVIDIGCDHAYLDIYLAKEKKCTCIASDINKKALENAKKNIQKYNLENIIETKLTDGLNDINVKKNDIIVISGMGTNTIKKILTNKKLSNNIIISSNNEIIELRKFMCSINYYIKDEKYILDNGKKYIIINFKKGMKKYKRIDFILGPILKQNVEFLNDYNKKINYVLDSIPKKYLKERLYYKYILYNIKKGLNNL